MSTDTDRKDVFRYFDKFFLVYSEKVDDSIVPEFLSEREFKRLLSNDFLKKIKEKTKISIKHLKVYRDSYYVELREKANTTANLIDALEKDKEAQKVKIKQCPECSQQFPSHFQICDNCGTELDESESTETIVDEMEELIKIFPKNEQFLARMALDSYKANPSFSKLNQLTKYIDRAEKKKDDKKEFSKVRLVPYRRPDWLAPKQNKIFDAVLSKKNLLVHGERQTGKDTSIFAAFLEILVGKKMAYPIFFMASKIDTARKIIKKMLAEERFGYIQPFICKVTEDYVTFYNEDGGTNKLELIDTTKAAVKGITGTLWVDDIDTIIGNHKQDVISLGVMVTRANSEINFVFTSNMGKGAYIALLEEWQDPKWDGQVSVLELKKDDVPHLTQEKDDFLWATIAALSGENVANAQLYNTYNADGDAFDPTTLKIAFDTYKYFMDVIEDTLTTERTVLSIDPAGTGDPWGWFIGRFGHDTIWELESGEMQMGKYDKNGLVWTPQRMTQFFINKYRQYNCNIVIIEGNMSGPEKNIVFRSNGLNSQLRNFSTNKNSPHSHAGKISLARHFFDSKGVVICNPKLKAELLIYNPALHKLSGADTKGHVADAFLHAVWELCGGYAYLSERLKEQEAMKNEEERVSFYG